MNQAYKAIQHEADHLFHKTESMVDDHHAAESIVKVSMDVREMIESDRTPRAVESRIIQLQKMLEPLAAKPGYALTPREAGELIDEYERLRRAVRKLPNY
jgi:hypothetical protein